MQWGLLVFWTAAVWMGTATPRRARVLRPVLALALLLSMGTQLGLLAADGLLRLETALPLHLCGLFGVLSIPMLWRAPDTLHAASAFLAAPAALLALAFPAVMPCSHPLLMQAAFFQLHALLTLMPLFRLRTGKPLPTQPIPAFLWGNGYLLLVGTFNRAFHTNYLFLRAAPAGTPLATLSARGGAFYLCALEMLCMLLFLWLRPLFIAGNTASYSRYGCPSAPCTSRRRE